MQRNMLLTSSQFIEVFLSFYVLNSTWNFGFTGGLSYLVYMYVEMHRVILCLWMGRNVCRYIAQRGEFSTIEENLQALVFLNGLE